MSTSDVQIVRLEPMRVASTYGFGEHPEDQAWQILAEWAKPKGLLDDIDAHPIFGFNNPYPTPDNPKYGYEFWIKVGPAVEPEGEVRIVEFLGGTYAVMLCEVKGHPEKNVPESWQRLAQWCRDNGRAFGHHHAMERFLSHPDDLDHLVLSLYCPVI